MTIVQHLQSDGALIETGVLTCGDHVGFRVHVSRSDLEPSGHQFSDEGGGPVDDVVVARVDLTPKLLAELLVMLKSCEKQLQLAGRHKSMDGLADKLVAKILDDHPDSERGPDFIDLGHGIGGVAIDNRWPDERKAEAIKQIADPGARKAIAEQMGIDPALVAELEPDLQA